MLVTWSLTVRVSCSLSERRIEIFVRVSPFGVKGLPPRFVFMNFF